MDKVIRTIRVEPETKTQRHSEDLCADMDEDCLDVPYPAYCWAYDPSTGPCPFIIQPVPEIEGEVENG